MRPAIYFGLILVASILWATCCHAQEYFQGGPVGPQYKYFRAVIPPQQYEVRPAQPQQQQGGCQGGQCGGQWRTEYRSTAKIMPWNWGPRRVIRLKRVRVWVPSQGQQQQGLQAQPWDFRQIPQQQADAFRQFQQQQFQGPVQ